MSDLVPGTSPLTQGGPEIVPFDYEGTSVRVVTGSDGEPHFVAADVAGALGFASAKDFVRGLDAEDRGRHIVPTPSGDQEMTIISEGGLYTARVRSRSERVKPFRRWVTHEVLPSIRRHGGYLTPAAAEQALTDPDFIIRLATSLKDERAKRAALEVKTAQDAPKVLFADAVATSRTAILVGDLAKLLCQNGIQVGANRLFRWLRDHGYLIARKGTDWNMPTQRSQEMGLFRVKETAVTHSDGHVTVSRTPKVTGKGQTYFVSRFLDGRLSLNDDVEEMAA